VLASRTTTSRSCFSCQLVGVPGNRVNSAGIVTFAWPGRTLYVVSILVAWYLIVFGIMHLVGALAGPQGGLLVDGAAAGGRRAGAWGVGGARVAAVAADADDAGGGVGDLLRVAEIFAAFSVREAGKRVERLVS
jgi:hypothetical protein